MAYADLLINSCSVYRNMPGAADPYGKPAENWAIVPTLEDIPCRLVPTSGQEVMIGAEVVIADYKLFLGNVSITEQDRVQVYAGTVPAWVTYEILLVMDRQDGARSHHKECLMRAVR